MQNLMQNLMQNVQNAEFKGSFIGQILLYSILTDKGKRQWKRKDRVRMMNRTRRFVILTMALIAVTTFSITGTVMSHGDRGLGIREEYFDQMEREYVREIRTFLNECGYENSGVMLTHVTGEDGSREYTVTVHNDKISKLSEEERAVLGAAILDMAFEAPECAFFQEFLSI